MGGDLMDVSKAFDCLPRDILFVKLVNYGFQVQTIILIRQIKKKCVRINPSRPAYFRKLN